MIKNIYDKWDELVALSKDNNRTNIIEYYFSKNCHQRFYLSIENNLKSLYIEFNKNEIQDYETPTISGLDISIVECDLIDASKLFIKIENNANNEDIYLAFISSLLDNCYDATSSYAVIQSLEETIKYFKDYFKNPQKQLSQKEEQGLCAELLQLGKYVDVFGENSIKNWLGPEKNKRDFVFENKAVEVKSTSSQTNTHISISNENQLDNNYPSNINLFLKVFILEKNDLGFDVVSLGKEIYNKIQSVELQHIFLSKLFMLNVDLNNYNPRYKFTLEKTAYYEITDEFPKISSLMLEHGIYNVKYDLLLEGLEKFEKSEFNE